MGMKINRIFTVLFAVLAVLLTVLSLWIVLRFRNAPAMILSISEDAAATAGIVMQAVCDGDYETAGKYMYGEPDLGIDRPASDAAGAMIWDAFQESLSYELVGECVASDGGISQAVIVRSLDFASVTENLEQRTQELLTQRVLQAEDVLQIYDENNEYRQSVVEEVISEAVAQALQEDARYVEQEFTVVLTYSEGKWWVMPDAALLRAISGGIAG